MSFLQLINVPANILIFKQIKMKSIYTIPKVVKYDDLTKPWFVFFRYDGKLIRKKYGINYIDNYKKRELEANSLRDALYKKLKDGWNPLIIESESLPLDLSLIDALDFAIEKKTPKISSKTLSGYNGTIKFIKTAVNAINLNNLQIIDTKRVHIKLIIEKAKEQRSWSNNAYNKHLNHLKAILSELIQWDIIEINPAFNVKNLEVSGDSDFHIPAADKDIERIKHEIQEKHPDFYTFIITVFHTGIRPEEILKIKLGMVNLEKYEIVLPAEITKTKKKRIVPINQHLMEYYKKMDFEKSPNNYYLFGSFRESGRGNIGKFKDFIPGPTHINRDTATRRWEAIVKKGLGINMTMYAMKHLGADKKILAGLDLDSLRELYGHTSKLMTEKYARVVKEVYRKNILENSPAF
jgi:integrase